MDLKKLYIEKAVYPAMTLLQHNRVTSYTKALLDSERQAPLERAAELRQRLTELLYLCRDQVPAYSDLSFTDLEMRRESLDCLQAVDPVPLAEFLSAAPQYLRRQADPAHLQHTAYGSGDRPKVDLYYTQSQLERYEAARWRGLSWYGVTYGSRSIVLWDRPRDPYYVQEEPYMRNRQSISVCAMTDRSVQPTLEEIDRFEPEYISGSSTGLATLAAHMKHTGLRLQHPLKVVTVTRGVMGPSQRQQLSEVFGCPVAQTLGMRTEGIIAYMCPEGNLHVAAENCFVEILDPQTWTPAAPGHPGLLAVTDLVGDTMPHLRVVLDYKATLREEPCSCGRTLPVIEGLQKMAPAE